MTEPKMIPACAAGPTHAFMVKWFPDLCCDREQEHAPPHRMRRSPGDVDWWWGGTIGKEEGLVLGMIRDHEKEQRKRDREAARERKRQEREAAKRDTKTLDLLAKGTR